MRMRSAPEKAAREKRRTTHWTGRPSKSAATHFGVLNLNDEEPPAPGAKLRDILTKRCATCGASGWVCEVHMLRPVGHDGCGWAGIPCRCNLAVGWDDD